MRGFVRASLLLFGTVAVGCGGEATGDDADSALSDGAAGKDVATDVRDTMPDPFVDNEAGSPADSGADEFPMAGDGGGCGTGTVTFQLNPGLGGPWQASTSGDEEPNWLAIFTASGAPLYLNPAEWALVDCNCARDWAVPIGWFDLELTDAGTSQSWDGFYFDIGQSGDSGACPSQSAGDQGGSCLLPGCAPPGQYVAYMCACNNPGPSSGMFSRTGVPSSYAYFIADCPNPTCVSVPFEYPSQTLVVGTVSESEQ